MTNNANTEVTARVTKAHWDVSITQGRPTLTLTLTAVDEDCVEYGVISIWNDAQAITGHAESLAKLFPMQRCEDDDFESQYLAIGRLINRKIRFMTYAEKGHVDEHGVEHKGIYLDGITFAD